MTRTQWTTVDQRTWLEGRKSKWLQAHAAGQTRTLRPKILADWYTAFPLNPPTPEELQKADGDSKKAERQKRRKMDEVRRLPPLPSA